MAQTTQLSEPVPLRIRQVDLPRLDQIAEREGATRSSVMRRLIARALDGVGAEVA